jgi:hypothetical protein
MLAMSDPPRRRWFRFRIRTLLLLTLLAVIALSIYSYWSDYMDESARREREMLSPAKGALCTVILRRDALGDELTDVRWLERADNFVSGKFFLMNDEWVVIDLKPGSQQWIPREHVLMLRVDD